MLLLPLEEGEAVARSTIPKATCSITRCRSSSWPEDARPYDEEFLLAALLHDVGKGIDPTDHVGAALQALDGLITERTQFLIEHHMHAQEYQAGTLGASTAARGWKRRRTSRT